MVLDLIVIGTELDYHSQSFQNRHPKSVSERLFLYRQVIT